MMNMYWEPLDFELPALSGRRWCLAADTAQPSPDDIADPGEEPEINEDTYKVQGRSVVILVNRAMA
jgi:glycogen operon protein